MTTEKQEPRWAIALQEQNEPRPAINKLLFWGWITAILISPIGFILGIITVAKGHVGHGVAMMTVSLLIMLSLNSTLV